MIIKKSTWIMLALMAINAGLNQKSNNSPSKDNGNSLKLPSFTGVLEVKNSIDGRVRFKIDALKENELLARTFLEQVKKISVIKYAEVNICLGTMLIEYDSSMVDGLTLQGAVMKLLGIDSQLEGNRTSRLRTSAENCVEALDSGIYEFTKGILDFKSVFIMIFLLGAFYDYRTYGRRIPAYPTLLWWCSRLL